ncbi:uncharacterized protein LOC111138164 [Crassostrea virginica]
MERKSQDGINKLSERPRVTTASSASITNPNYCGPEEEEGRGGRVQQMQCLDEGNMVIIYCNADYLFSCSGAIRLLQVFLSLCCLLALVTCSGPDGGDFLSLPQSWRPRVLLFVIVWTSLTGLSLWGVKVTGLDQMLPISWWLLDFLLYSTFSFSYLVSTSILANYIEHLKLIENDLPRGLFTKFLISVVLGYICVLLYGFTAFVGYRRWRIQCHLFKRRKLLESEDFLELL